MNTSKKRKRFDNCCNPFELEKHGRKPHKTLRKISPAILKKLECKNPSITEECMICDSCRLRLSKIPDTIEAMDSSSTISEPNPDTSALSSTSGSDLSEFRIEEDIEVKTDGNQNILRKLEDSFRATSDRNLKIRILTIFEDWSFYQIRQHFDASNRMIAVAKSVAADHGILSSPNGRLGRRLPEDFVKGVVDFYTSDHMSRVMAGKRNCVTIREDGQKVTEQKRLILTNLRETYRIFTEKYPDVTIGFSKFCELRPKHCILPGATGTHSVCVCAIHENVKLMIDGARITQLTSDTLHPIRNYKDCLAQILCNPPSRDCHLKKCERCPGTSNFIEQLHELFNNGFKDTVIFRQ